MKKLTGIAFVAVMCMISLTSCNELKKENALLLQQKDSLQNVVNAQKLVIDQKTDEVNEFLTLVAEVQQTMQQIREKENMVSVKTGEGDTPTSLEAKEQLKQDIKDLYQLVQDNRKKMDNLRYNLNKANKSNKEMQEIVKNLESQMAVQEKEIADLRKIVEQKNGQIDGLEKIISTKSEQIAGLEKTVDQQTVTLNTAWYCVTTKKDLIANGLIDKKGRVIQADNKNFTQVDLTTLKEIPINSKKATLLSAHPETSYELVMNGKIYEKLVIKDAAKFWQFEKRLVILVK